MFFILPKCFWAVNPILGGYLKFKGELDIIGKWRFKFLRIIYMGMPKNVREAMSAEAAAEVEIMQELEGLFRQLEADGVNEDRREELAGDIRQTLERYNQLFHGEEGAKELLSGYYDRLEKVLAKPAA